MKIIIIIKKPLPVLIRNSIRPIREVIIGSRSADAKPGFARVTGYCAFPDLPTWETAVASGILRMDTDAIIPSYEAAWITTIPEDVESAIVASRTDVIRPYDTTNTL